MNIDLVRTFEEPSRSETGLGKAPSGDGFDEVLSSSMTPSRGTGSARRGADSEVASRSEPGSDRSDASDEESVRAEQGSQAARQGEDEAASEQARNQQETSDEKVMRDRADSGEEEGTREEDLTLERGITEAEAAAAAQEVFERGAQDMASDLEAHSQDPLADSSAPGIVAENGTFVGERVEAEVATQVADERASNPAPVVSSGEATELSEQAVVAAAVPDELQGRGRPLRQTEENAAGARSDAAPGETAESGRQLESSAAGSGLAQHDLDREREDESAPPRDSEMFAREVASVADSEARSDETNVVQRTFAPVEANLGQTAIDGASVSANLQAQAVPVNAILSAGNVAPGTPIPPPPADALAIQAQWLAARGGGSARLILHPPELGEIAVRVTLRGGAVDVVLIAQEASARSLAEGQAERLAEAFSNRDLRLENFEVRRGDSGPAEDEASGFLGADAQDRQQAREESESRSEASASGGPAHRDGEGRAVHSENEMPRIVTVAAASGVDLRI